MPKKLLEFRARATEGFKVVAKSATKAEITLYGTIGQDWFGEGITAKSFDAELKKLDSTVNDLTIRINSGGGSVFDGITIYNRIKQHKAKVTVQIDGLAASIASVIALAGDEIIMGEGALFMIHLPWTYSAGDRLALDKVIDDLMVVEDQMISIYSKKTGLPRADVKKMMEAETWMNSDEALEKGFVTATSEESMPIAASIMDCKWFAKKPTKFNSVSAAVNKAKIEMKEKLAKQLARK